MAHHVSGRPLSTRQYCLFTCGDLNTHLTRGSLDQPESTSQMPCISIGSAAFAGRTVVTDRQTDRPRYSVCSNGPHLASSAMRPKFFFFFDRPAAIQSEIPGSPFVSSLSFLPDFLASNSAFFDHQPIQRHLSRSTCCFLSLQPTI